MAVWQVDFYLIKREKINLYDETKPWGNDANEELLSWANFDINTEAIQTLSKSLMPSKSWSSTTKQFGKIDETCLEISTFENEVCQIFIRLDIRTLSRELLYEIMCFIQANNAAIVYNNKCYQVDEEALLKIIKKSNAYKFCKDPEGFLTSLKTEKH